MWRAAAGWVIVLAALPAIWSAAPAGALAVPTVAVVSSLNPANVRRSVTFTATVTAPGGGNPTGSVVFFNSSAVTLCGATALSGGRATCTVRPAAGTRTIYASYSGDSTYSATYSPGLTQEVVGDPVTIAVSSAPNPTVAGQPFTLRAKVSRVASDAPAPTGEVSFDMDGVDCSRKPLVGGEATCTVGRPAGSYLYTASYSGDAWFRSATSAAATQAVGQAATRVALTSPVNPSTGGEYIELLARIDVLAPGRSERTWWTWNVTFEVSYQAESPCTTQWPIVMNGVWASCRFAPPAGSFTARAVFHGNDDLTRSVSETLVQTVTPGATTVTVTSSLAPSPFDEPVTLRAEVDAAAPSTYARQGMVTFEGVPLPCGDRPVLGDVATCTGYLSRGTYVVSATFGGDERYAASASPPRAHVVGPARVSVALRSSSNPSAPGAPVTLTAAVSPWVWSTGTPTGTVRFREGPTVLCEAALQNREASCAVPFPRGDHAIAADYLGDANFGEQTSSLTQVAGLTPDVSFTATPTRSVSGESVTFRVELVPRSPGAGSPAGTVTFSISGAVGCTGVALAGGVATCTASLRSGYTDVKAEYRGDGTYLPLTSYKTHWVAQAEATVTLTSSARSGPATLTAVVSVKAPGAASTYGSVTFRAGGVVLCFAVHLPEGSGSCQATLGPGTGVLTAYFTGNAEVMPATSAPLDPNALAGDGFVTVTPARLLDTRVGTGGPAVPLAARSTREVVVRGGATGVPDTATAVVLNVTVTGSAAAGHLTVHPSGVPQPNASTLNFAAGQTVPNLVMSGIGTGGRISIYSSAGNAHVLADVVGYHLPGGGAAFGPLTPSRLLDTRTGTGGPATPVGPGRSRELVVRGGATGVPDDATAVVLNMTATAPSAASYLTVHPSGGVRPTTSSLNFVAGQTVPNLVVVGIGAGGRVSIFNAAGSTHVLADVVGFYRPGAGSTFTALTPSRLLDTRNGTGGPATPVGAGATRAVPARGGATGIPEAASAVVLNVTVAFPSAASYLTVFPSGTARPNASNLNYGAGQFASNLVVVGIGSDGTISAFNALGSVHLVADVVGYMS